MNTPELTVLLTRMSIVDGRDVDQLTLEAWEPLIGDLDYADAVDGLNEHYRTDSRRPTAAQIRVCTDTARRKRLYAGKAASHHCIPHRHSLAEEVGSCRVHHWAEWGDRCEYGCTR